MTYSTVDEHIIIAIIIIMNHMFEASTPNGAHRELRQVPRTGSPETNYPGKSRKIQDNAQRHSRIVSNHPGKYRKIESNAL